MTVRSATTGAWIAPGPDELPDLRLHMREQMLHPIQQAAFTMRVIGGSSPLFPLVSGPPSRTVAAQEEAGRVLALREHRRLGEAELFWVDADMTSLALAAAATPCAESVMARRMPAEAGLMLFAQPIGNVDYPFAETMAGPFFTPFLVLMPTTVSSSRSWPCPGRVGLLPISPLSMLQVGRPRPQPDPDDGGQ
ncbi:hypothetical protein [Amycolatopsis sp. H20-H5]|uniref:hypothetical protein n=1 Tax=Amycolatopsis sp. H20-H5 TaxID=3046309 RepID=UPI002DBA4221|nr:hypothetical protein [Amycolatopsis sp. H20-H5]MEC3974904.1 hypothetical protein [Amycolatopsis sp. H20-H5]